MKPTEQDVITAIRVLKAYIEGTLETHQCDFLDDCIAKAYDILLEDTYDDYSENELLEESLRNSGYAEL
jgi:hypothetical protein